MAHVHEATEFAGVNVKLTGSDYVTPAKNAERELAAAGFAAKLAAKDATLWGPDAEGEETDKIKRVTVYNDPKTNSIRELVKQSLTHPLINRKLNNSNKNLKQMKKT